MMIRNHYYSMIGVVAFAASAAVVAAGDPPADHPYVQTLCEGNPALLRLDSHLLEARAAVRSGVRADDAIRAHLSGSMRGGQLEVVIATSDIPATVAACRTAGLDVVGTYDNYGVKNVTVRCSDPTKLDAIANLGSTTMIFGEPAYEVHAGSIAGQGDAALNSDTARTNHSIDGTGVRVGVISDSIFDTRLGSGVDPGVYPGAFTGTTDQVLGDLPASVWVIDPGAGGNTDEGNGMAQIVHDIAPGADISFAAASGYFAFASNVTALHTDATNPADVICDDVYFFAEPIYQDGPIALAYEGAYAAGVPGFSSAGNSAANAHESVYSDINGGSSESSVPPTTGVDFHDFGGGDTHLAVSVTNGSVITLILKWSQPYGGGGAAGPGSEADYNLYLVNNATWPAAGSVIASSTTAQGSSGSPSGDSYEIVQVQNTLGSTQSWHAVIDHRVGVTGDTVYLSVSGATIVDTGLIGARTIVGHAAAANVLAVAATYFCEVTGDPLSLFGPLAPGDVFSPFAPQIDVESFSSLGGSLPYFYDGTGASMATEFRDKPEITAPDGVNTTFFGQLIFVGLSNALCNEDDSDPNFFGTSAAAPHAAAVAALLLEVNPAASPAQVYTAMRSTAIDIESAGDLASGDYLAGDGLIDADAAAATGVPIELSAFGIE